MGRRSTALAGAGMRWSAQTRSSRSGFGLAAARRSRAMFRADPVRLIPTTGYVVLLSRARTRPLFAHRRRKWALRCALRAGHAIRLLSGHRLRHRIALRRAQHSHQPHLLYVLLCPRTTSCPSTALLRAFISMRRTGGDWAGAVYSSDGCPGDCTSMSPLFSCVFRADGACAYP